MKTIPALFLSALICFASVQQTQPLLDASGSNLNGLVRATVLVYDSESGTDFIWTGTTDGSLPPLKLVGGYIHNIEQVLPGYIKDAGELWIEIRIDGRRVTAERIRYSGGTDGLHRESPTEPGDVSETLEDELQIGLPGQEHYVATSRFRC